MTEQQPPQGRPEFQPPGGNPPDQPAAHPQQPPAQPYQPPVSPAQAYPPPGAAYPQQGQPYPTSGRPFPQQGQPGNYPPYQVPQPLPSKGRGSIWMGIGITIAALLASWGLAVSVRYDSPLASLTNLLAAGLPFALVLGGIVMAAIPRTTRTGAGILIGIGAGILIAGGLCFALVLGVGFGG